MHQRNFWCCILATVEYFPLMFDTAPFVWSAVSVKTLHLGHVKDSRDTYN